MGQNNYNYVHPKPVEKPAEVKIVIAPKPPPEKPKTLIITPPPVVEDETND